VTLGQQQSFEPSKTGPLSSSSIGEDLLKSVVRYSFAAYAASKAALNQALRVRSDTSYLGQKSCIDAPCQHMAAELKRKGSQTIVLAMHPGEVAT
jgi:NAD(P)-dependent dehydrogenase (short-subunit alcohol dehydrogenase family)